MERKSDEITAGVDAPVERNPHVEATNKDLNLKSEGRESKGEDQPGTKTESDDGLESNTKEDVETAHDSTSETEMHAQKRDASTARKKVDPVPAAPLAPDEAPHSNRPPRFHDLGIDDQLELMARLTIATKTLSARQVVPSISTNAFPPMPSTSRPPRRFTLIDSDGNGGFERIGFCSDCYIPSEMGTDICYFRPIDCSDDGVTSLLEVIRQPSAKYCPLQRHRIYVHLFDWPKGSGKSLTGIVNMYSDQFEQIFLSRVHYLQGRVHLYLPPDTPTTCLTQARKKR